MSIHDGSLSTIMSVTISENLGVKPIGFTSWRQDFNVKSVFFMMSIK
ncbi:hypothetical protein SAMN05428642_1011126 [Flaviramulus basaltis]|uniref:Uncharacterized protein n=1 Tax=Flaviramulus basaltis TaxID=369401 RepID=A0A1K2IEA5_9FLAO|nr:hypothetical protein [Flaviramulus basaltis]SFZ90764.1 hypothetical protein SAMN05428642_1011126 [Flaviramulus basaltis]